MRVIARDGVIEDNSKIYIEKSNYDTPPANEHFHEFLEIVYIASGTAAHWINGKPCKASIGDLYMLDFSDEHTFEERSDDFTIITLAFTPELIDDSLVESNNAQDILGLVLFRPFFEQNGGLRFSMNLFHQEKEVSGILEEMIAEYTRKETGYHIMLRAYLMILLSKIFRNALKGNAPEKNAYHISTIDAAIVYLEQNYSRPFNLNEIARVALLSPSYFSTLFKSQTGVSITDFTQKIRIEQACKLLNNPKNSVNAVMELVGYNDSKFFYQLFKRHMGVTPGEYKKGKRNGD